MINGSRYTNSMTQVFTRVNMFMEPYYLELEPKSTIIEPLLHTCIRDNDWFGLDKTGGTVIKKTPHRSIIEQDDFLREHILPRQPKTQWETVAHIFLMEPYTHYTMHTDGNRGCSVNLLINPEADSVCYFKSTEEAKFIHGICELKYHANTYYLFNSGEPHAVTNLGKRRYLLSLTLAQRWEDHRDLVLVL
jgi:hypothetical protein